MKRTAIKIKSAKEKAEPMLVFHIPMRNLTIGQLANIAFILGVRVSPKFSKVKK